ncbi:MAG: iron-containing alcohol dehydrogenase [Sphaerochaetaceae bacterium]|nr:iron-containing alcohol dehydrogenase [Sphaerochaetaceae bacterium]MDD3162797.1 iron-containing alcohol dehydrogenase [Sphaerochaetaceae bacterium]MDD4006878.1 iron-containing alcohol dehydrogenase [Sphaerochaetaceae bacterium]MDD4396010.1 iron-containing alcohol dehydrogenase [Sphaerochaetaceae bacterium]
MKSFEYSCTTNIVFGNGRTAEAGSMCKGHGKVLVVYGGGSVVRNGILAKITASLDENGVPFVLFSGVKPNPDLGKVQEGLDVLRKENCSFVLAVGGGSVIDTCKAIALADAAGDAVSIWNRAFLNGEGLTASIQIGVVLTIAASGSETGESCVISHDGAKLIASSDSMIPQFAILDPENTLSLPAFQTACSSADILSHLQERYFVNVPGNDLSDRFLEAAMRLVIQTAMMLSCDPGNLALREQLMWTGTLAHNGLLDRGRNGGDWACHMIEHEVSARFPVTHGEGLAMITASWMRFAASKPECRSRLLQFSQRVWDAGFPDDNPDLNIAYAIMMQENWYRSLGLKTSLSQVDGITPSMLEQIASSFSWQPGQFVVLDNPSILAILMNSYNLDKQH